MNPLDKIDKACIAMNSDMRFLARVYHSKVNSDQSYSNQKRLNLAINFDPTVVMKRVGPHLLKHADVIHKQDIQFYTGVDPNIDENELGTLGPSSQDTSTGPVPGRAAKVLAIIRKVYGVCNTEEREKVMVTVSDMLSHYCEYHLAVSEMC